MGQSPTHCQGQPAMLRGVGGIGDRTQSLYWTQKLMDYSPLCYLSGPVVCCCCWGWWWCCYLGLQLVVLRDCPQFCACGSALVMVFRGVRSAKNWTWGLPHAECVLSSLSFLSITVSPTHHVGLKSTPSKCCFGSLCVFKFFNDFI